MKNGFTLVELLAVIVILTSITFLITFTVSHIISTNKEKLENIQLTIAKDAVGMLIVDNPDKFADRETCYYVTIQGLIDSGYVDEIKVDNIKDELFIIYDGYKIDMPSSINENFTVEDAMYYCDSAFE